MFVTMQTHTVVIIVSLVILVILLCINVGVTIKKEKFDNTWIFPWYGAKAITAFGGERTYDEPNKQSGLTFEQREQIRADARDEVAVQQHIPRVNENYDEADGQILRRNIANAEYNRGIDVLAQISKSPFAISAEGEVIYGSGVLPKVTQQWNPEIETNRPILTDDVMCLSFNKLNSVHNTTPMCYK
jgi:hypothetical protein